MESLADRIGLCFGEFHFFSFLRTCSSFTTNELIRHELRDGSVRRTADDCCEG
jgi:hypothetical protein